MKKMNKVEQFDLPVIKLINKVIVFKMVCYLHSDRKKEQWAELRAQMWIFDTWLRLLNLAVEQGNILALQ